jgi:TRAP-type mannitol/chloroaromatic compound transport system permease small subunit
MIDTILDPQIWLVLVAVVHAVVGVILPTEWEDDTNKLVSGWFLLTTVTMLGTAFLLEGEPRMGLVRHHMRPGPGVEPG